MNRLFWFFGAGCWVVLGLGFLVSGLARAAEAQATASDYEVLRKELLAMRETDQRFRDLAPPSIKSTDTELAIIKQQDDIDRTNMARLEQIVKKYGWPGIKQVGEPASSAAFLVLQHAQLEDQRRFFPILKAAVAEKNARPDHAAMLEDRILVREGKKQRYGTNVYAGPDTHGKLVLSPVEDEANVDARRAAVGLIPLAEYLKEFGIEYVGPK